MRVVVVFNIFCLVNEKGSHIFIDLLNVFINTDSNIQYYAIVINTMSFIVMQAA